MPKEKEGSLSEQELFLKDLEQSTSPFEAEIQPPVVEEPKKEEKPEEDAGNRKYRRLQEKYHAERESSIQLAERLKALEDAQKLKSDDAADYLKKVEKIYGTDSPEATAATELLKSAMSDLEARAVERAYQKFADEQAREKQAQFDAEKALDSMVEDIEDTYNVSLDDSTQKSFFQLLSKLSPKDKSGNVLAYADHHAVWEELQARKAKPENPAKSIASRSMVRNGSSPESTVQQDSQERWLRENGLI